MIAQTCIVDQADATDAAVVGAKAAHLSRLQQAGISVPPFIVMTPSSDVPADDLHTHIARLTASGRLLAVRSSSPEEDGAGGSFAGLLESYLDVAAADVTDRIARVRQSASAPRVLAYRKHQGLAGAAPPCAVIVQMMLRPEVSGVAFGADPLTGTDAICVINAVAGCAAPLVDGEVEGQAWRVDRAGEIVEQSEDDGAPPLLTQVQLRRVAELTHQAGELFGCPQDVEWAIEDGKLWMVQARPITTAAVPSAAQPRRVWDNANISESYGGVTTPVTYTFACSAYAGVYRAFCHLMGVSRSRIAANSDLFPNMLGHFRGRVYYNLYNWYRLIALLPGYRSNRVFMEQMMGVREAMPDEIIGNLKPPGWRGRLRDRLELFGSVLGLGMRYLSLGRLTRRFHKRLEAALAGSAETLETMRLNELAKEYRRLERTLLSRWDAPLVNDFFTMICFGVLRRSAERWAGEQGWAQVGRLLGGAKGMVSIEPAQQIAAMGEIAAATEGAAQTLAEAEPAAVRQLLRNHPSLNAAVATYLDRFGDRCMEELKLESPTLHEQPSPLWRAVGRAAVQVQRGGHAHEHTAQVWSEAWHELKAAVGRRPLRKAAMYVLVRAARRHLILRENLRFERTRVFGRVRRIVLQMGKRLADRGTLEHAADVFYLEIGELFDAAENDKLEGLRTQASARRTRFEQYAQQPAPPSRFETHGSADLDTAIPIDMPNPIASDLPLQGTGCYPGVVRAVVRCVHDPQHAQPQPGQILVAERTDPGWVMLFPGAAGVLVQRGSILSHSATLAREMGIPTIVGLPRLMDRLHDGDLVEMDGAAGTARVVESADGESAPTIRRSEG